RGAGVVEDIAAAGDVLGEAQEGCRVAGLGGAGFRGDRTTPAGGAGGICGGAIRYVTRHAIGQRIGNGGVEHLLAVLAGDVHLLPEASVTEETGEGSHQRPWSARVAPTLVSSSGSTGVGPSTKEPVCSSLMRCAMDLSPEVPSSA